jgi:hypothetical protein
MKAPAFSQRSSCEEADPNDLPPRRKREQYVVITAGGHPKIKEESLSHANRRLHPTLTDASTWTRQASGEEQPVQVTVSARRLFVPHTGSGWIVGKQEVRAEQRVVQEG